MVDGTREDIFMPAFISIFPMSPPAPAASSRIRPGREEYPLSLIHILSAGTWQDALSSGIIDVAFDDGVVFAGPLNVNENLRLLDGNGPSYLNGVAFAQGNYVMKDVFDLYIQRLKVNGDYAACLLYTSRCV